MGFFHLESTRVGCYSLLQGIFLTQGLNPGLLHCRQILYLLSHRKIWNLVLVFPIVMYGCESWTIKKTKHWRIDAFELWCWRRLLRGPWTTRKYNQSILKEISPEYSLEGLMLKPILWPPDVKNWLIWKDPDAGKDWRQEKKGMTEDEMVGWHHQCEGHEFDQALVIGDGQHAAVHGGHKESDMTERLNWTATVFQKIVKKILAIFISVGEI